MPGLDFYKTPEPSSASALVTIVTVPETPIEESNRAAIIATPSPAAPLKTGVYYNPRLDPENFLDGPLSWDPATRLRQMLARPGIVVRTDASTHDCQIISKLGCRLPLVFAMVSVPGVHLRRDLIVCIKVGLLPRLRGLVNQTLLSRL